ncbi:GNAT family N-acetyltransferase [Microbacterium sp. NPDC055683]
MSLETLWPLFALELATPRLRLRLLRDDDLAPLADAAIAGIHDRDRTPFQTPWADAEPATLRREFARFHWGRRARISPGSWGLSFAVRADGVPVGIQDLDADDFAALRTVHTGSWLTRSAQGRGIGTEMRAAVLLFAFDVLGAEWAVSGAASWNAASLGVSRRLGYRENGITRVHPQPGQVDDMIGLRLAAEEFARPDWALQIDGAEAARHSLVGEPV